MKAKSYGQNVLIRPKSDYTPLALKMTWDIKSVKHEYSRMRKIYIQRAKRLYDSEYKNSTVLETRPPERYKNCLILIVTENYFFLFLSLHIS